MWKYAVKVRKHALCENIQYVKHKMYTVWTYCTCVVITRWIVYKCTDINNFKITNFVAYYSQISS